MKKKEWSDFVLKKSDFPATHGGKPTVLHSLSVVPRSEEKRNLLVTSWTSPGGDKEYSDELTKIRKAWEPRSTSNDPGGRSGVAAAGPSSRSPPSRADMTVGFVRLDPLQEPETSADRLLDKAMIDDWIG